MQSPSVAIVGIGGIFPDAPELTQFWDNIRSANSATREVPPGRWQLPADAAFDPEPGKADHVYSRRGCFIENLAPASELPGLRLEPAFIKDLDPLFHLLLHAGTRAFASGVTKPLDRSRVGVIIGNLALPSEKSAEFSRSLLGRSFEEKLLGQANQVAPVDPTVVPSTKCGVEGSYTIPTTTGISYLLTGTTIAAGTYPGPASGTVTAVATTGYVLTTPGWSVALSVPAAAPCAQAVITVVTPVDPTVAASTTCEVQGSYTIPATTGITYRLGGEVVKAGPYVGPASGTVTAEANPGYTLSTTGWSFTLTVAAPAICPEAAAPAVEAPATGTTATTTTTTAALPKTGAPVATLGITGVLALLLGLALIAVGTRRPVRDLS